MHLCRLALISAWHTSFESCPYGCHRQAQIHTLRLFLTFPRCLFLPDLTNPKRFLSFGTTGLARVPTNIPTFQSKTYPALYLSSPNPHIFHVINNQSFNFQRCRPSYVSRIIFILTKPATTIATPPAANTLSPPSASQSTASPLRSDRKTLRHAQYHPDAAEWDGAHDAWIYRSLKLQVWTSVPAEGINKEMLVNARWQYKYKTSTDGYLDKRPSRFTVRGDQMQFNAHCNPAKTASQSLSYTAHKIFRASADVKHDHVESWDVPEAFPRAATDLDYVCYLSQPSRSEGSLTHPGCRKQREIYRIDGSQQGNPAAGYYWEETRDPALIKLGWR